MPRMYIYLLVRVRLMMVDQGGGMRGGKRTSHAATVAVAVVGINILGHVIHIGDGRDFHVRVVIHI